MLTGSPEGYAVTLVGHADPRGSEAYNEALGLRRAQTTQDYLASQGVPRTSVIVRPAENRMRRARMMRVGSWTVGSRSTREVSSPYADLRHLWRRWSVSAAARCGGEVQGSIITSPAIWLLESDNTEGRRRALASRARPDTFARAAPPDAAARTGEVRGPARASRG